MSSNPEKQTSPDKVRGAIGGPAHACDAAWKCRPAAPQPPSLAAECAQLWGAIRRRTSRRTWSLVVVVLALLAVVYLMPVLNILRYDAKRLPVENSDPSRIVEVQALRSNEAGVLLLASERFLFSNDPFPSVIRATRPGASPRVPAPRIRTSISKDRDWYSNFIIIMFFPVGILAGGGAVFASIFAIPVLAVTHRKNIVISAVVLILLIAAIYFLAIWPTLLREHYARERPLVWAGSHLIVYLRTPSNEPVIVVNGRTSPIDLFVDGLWVDRIPATGYRKYKKLREFSRLSSVDAITQVTLDDVSFQPTSTQEGTLIYNVHGVDILRIENPPEYH